MNCHRCAEQDDYRLGTDEQPHAEWLILCDRCEREVTEDKAAAADLAAEATGSRCYERPVQARGIRGPMRARGRGRR
jgi:hypothetical protein